MQVEVSRRKFLQGTVAMTIVGRLFQLALPIYWEVKRSSHTRYSRVYYNKDRNWKQAKEVATLCEMCVNKCAATC